MEELIPDCSSVIRNHLVIVLEVNALWGLINEINNLVSLPRGEFVLSRYVLRIFTGQRVIFGKKEGKKHSSFGFPWRDCFAKVPGGMIFHYSLIAFSSHPAVMSQLI